MATLSVTPGRIRVTGGSHNFKIYIFTSVKSVEINLVVYLCENIGINLHVTKKKRTGTKISFVNRNKAMILAELGVNFFFLIN